MDVIRRLQTRVAGMVARAVISGVNNALKTQNLQLVIRDDKDVHDDVEHLQPYGFSSVPPVGSEALVLSVNGSAAHSVAVCAHHPEKRPKDGEPDSVGLYTDAQWRLYIDPVTGIVHLGAKAGADFIAKAGRVDAEFTAVKADIDALKNALAGISGTAPSGGGAVVFAPFVATLPTAHSPATVATTKTKAT